MTALSRRLDFLVLVHYRFPVRPVYRLPFPRVVLALRQRISARTAFLFLNVVTMTAASPAAYVRYFIMLTK